MLERLKMRKYQEIFLIDSENVGYQLPKNLPKTAYIYLFVSNYFVLEKLNTQLHKYHKQLEIVDIEAIVKQNQTKNAMDFCIVSKLSEMIQKTSKKQKIVIVSKDKGYDAAIEFVKKQTGHSLIERYSLPIIYYYNSEVYVQTILGKLDPKILKLISCHQTMSDLKSFLTKKQKKKFVITEYTEDISGIKIFIEYDIYLNLFSLYYSGNIKKQYLTLDEAQRNFQKLIHQTKQKYQKYYSKELLVKAKQLNIHPYIEEAYLKNKPLQECLVNHFGQNEGTQLFNQFIHS